MGPSAMVMKDRFDAAGLSLSDDIHEPPDHLSVELEYLYFLLKKAFHDKDEALISKAASFASEIMLPWLTEFPRVIETKQFERVGDHRSVSVDVRIITATNKDLEELIAQTKFREDLYFRINVIPIHLPPLRERMEHIPLLVNSFLRRLQAKTGKNTTGLTPDAMERFMDYHWPGNVRELKSALEYAFVIAEKGLIRPGHLPQQIRKREKAKDPVAFPTNRQNMAEEKDLIRALRQSKGNQSQAARILGVNRVTLWNRMRKYDINLQKVISS